MMQGFVNANCEAMLRLVIGNETSNRQVIDAVIDTGFTGFLTLPYEMMAVLSLSWVGSDRGTLGDGSETTFEVYEATIIWDGQFRSIPVNAAETDPLVGMSLLYGYNLQIQAIEGGIVRIEALVAQ